MYRKSWLCILYLICKCMHLSPAIGGKPLGVDCWLIIIATTLPTKVAQSQVSPLATRLTSTNRAGKGER